MDMMVRPYLCEISLKTTYRHAISETEVPDGVPQIHFVWAAAEKIELPVALLPFRRGKCLKKAILAFSTYFITAHRGKPHLL
jgi:hypothetical protein